ncbi:uncharacterized protein TEOVI_000630800 [Trypanosoma equiperdum]|uniref:Uncharacterized protein n=2 Tax=Trypanozoon TaxID=39700 RepID=Q57U97_TRYB2|nr:hypothetical protein, conserved [Trypanosoma brucei brucei TREU927]AAX70822.1 hypothetical protein, conserved [Trypanosoma brucei]AAZ11480.1 hypothetical protein, conserved [Trypanosoma brucei brucei TREU927]SCU68220.1 hypothetical protein, conserved [Trypanosoma equiperdum]
MFVRLPTPGKTCVSRLLISRRFTSAKQHVTRRNISSHNGGATTGQKSVGGKNFAKRPEDIAPHSSKGSAAGPTMRRSRFYRIALDHGFGFAVYFYILGESMTLSVLYALHSNALGTGDTFAWMNAVGAERFVNLDRWAHAGPTVVGVTLSFRLLLNYLAANAIMYPMYGMQMRFCVATFGVLGKGFNPLRRLRALGRNVTSSGAKRTVPRAPSATAPKNKVNRLP